MLLAILPLLIWISIADLRSHRIPNLALALLALVGVSTALIGGHDWAQHVIATFIVLFVAITAWFFLGLGMGDLKFLTLLALLILPANLSNYQLFILCFSFASFIHLLFSTKGRLLRSAVLPLAPAISFATVVVLSS